MKFTATYIEPYTNDITANVMFADPETDPDQPSVLSFSRPIEPGFEDSAYYFEVNDQSYGSYGGLVYAKLTRDSIEIRLEEYLVEKFGEDDLREIRAEFQANDELYASILETMKRIFQGHDILQTE
ncbi:MAG: hypothetical protein KA314_09085 [Chloroflexi bacterium]|nr:hypothetical protein [Chloroflexota bacterium]MBP8055984.1 hypothetical protein [Chloroflexota bacterium]